MTIYIEPYAVQNVLIGYLVGATSYRLLRVKKEWWRLLLSAFSGGAAALVYPLLSLPVAADVACKIALGLLLGVVLYAGKCPYLKGMAAMCATALLYGGAVFAVGFLRFSDVSRALRTPLGVRWCLFVLAAIVLYHLICAAVTAWHRKSDTSALLYEYRCVSAGRTFCGKGFLDTGNRLYDRKTGLPVVVLSARAVLPCLSDGEAALVLSGHADKVFAGARKMRCGGIGGGASLWIFAPESFEVYLDADKNIVLDVMVGLSFAALGKDYDAILHPAMGNAAKIISQ